MRADAQNLQAIVAAINQHNLACPNPATAVAMNPFEIERLGWDSIKGLPIRPDEKLGTGRFRIICANDEETPDAVSSTAAMTPGRELVPAAA